MRHVAVYSAVVLHGPPLKEIPGFEPLTYIDRLAAEKWKKLGLTPSPTCDDATFIRRVTIDLCGRLPTVDETREFLDENVGRIVNPSDKQGDGSKVAGGESTRQDRSDGLTIRPTNAADKRTRLIDRLLDSPDYPAY